MDCRGPEWFKGFGLVALLDRVICDWGAGLGKVK